MKKNKGFTLIELMIVIAIIGILAAVGYPSYVSHVKKANRADGIDSLVALSGRMEEFYLVNDSYTGATVGNATSSDSLYTMAISVQNDYTYTITATPIKGDSDCGVLSLTSLGVKGVSTTTAVADCW